MELSRVVKLKRRKSGSSGPPSSLKEGELGFNEVDKVLYYGAGDDGDGNSNNIIPIAGGFTNLIKDAQVSNMPTGVTPSDDYLIVNINGTQRALRLFDF